MADLSDRPSLRAEQVQQTRAALIASGRRLFGERGFAATSVEEIARDARVTTGALYHHFPNKTALFEAVFEQIHAELLAASARASEATGPDIGELELFARGPIACISPPQEDLAFVRHVPHRRGDSNHLSAISEKDLIDH